MLRFLGFLFLACIAAIATGYLAFKMQGDDATGNLIIGIAVVVIALCIMPAFVFIRYRHRKLDEFTMDFNEMKKKAEEYQKNEGL